MSSPNASSRWPKCASARASRAGAEGARRDTMPGGGGALAAVHSGKRQAATGQLPSRRVKPGRCRVPAPTQIGGLFSTTRTKTPYLPTYCGRQSPGSVPHLPTYSQAAQRSEKIPVSPL